MDGDLEQLLQAAQGGGEWESAGVFTLDAVKARVKLARFQLAPGLYAASLGAGGSGGRVRAAPHPPW